MDAARGIAGAVGGMDQSYVKTGMHTDTPRTTDRIVLSRHNRPDAEVVSADFARQLERELAEARRDASVLEDVMLRNGFVKCDIPACNCGSWHHRYGLPERMDEIREALRDADVLDNSTGNLPLNAIKKLHMQRDEARQLLADIRADAQCAHWHKDIDAMMKAE